MKTVLASPVERVGVEISTATVEDNVEGAKLGTWKRPSKISKGNDVSQTEGGVRNYLEEPSKGNKIKCKYRHSGPLPSDERMRCC